MRCFIKSVWEGKGEEAHPYFVRFGKGRYENRAVLNLQKTTKIKLRGSFEWANDFVEMVSEFGGGKVSGEVLSKEDISDFFRKNNLKGNSEAKKGGLFYKNNLPEQNLSMDVLKELVEVSYVTLLDITGVGFVVKVKKKLPKPGKSKEGKIDSKFCQLEADLRYWPAIKEAFMLPECKKAKMSHEFIIEEIIIPEESKEEDFAKIREVAKRKGKIIRKVEADKKESREEKEFVA